MNFSLCLLEISFVYIQIWPSIKQHGPRPPCFVASGWGGPPPWERCSFGGGVLGGARASVPVTGLAPAALRLEETVVREEAGERQPITFHHHGS